METLDLSLTGKIIGASFAVHGVFGYGFLEAVYRNALAIELRAADLIVECEKRIEVIYKSQSVGTYFADMVVNGSVIVEIKTVQKVIREHFKQTEHYLKATGLHDALLINFNRSSVEYHRVFVKW